MVGASNNLNDTRRTIWACAAVIAAIGSVFTGLVVRDRMDLGSAASAAPRPAGLVASGDAKEVPAEAYYRGLVDKLKDRYVDPIDDDSKLAYGSVRGMIGSLNDPNSIYMDPAEFKAYKNSLVGKYEGIGAELSLLSTDETSADTGQGPDGSEAPSAEGSGPKIRIPSLVVVGLTPGGPASKAGVKLGDIVEYVDEKWLINGEAIERFRDLNQKVQQKKLPMSALIEARKSMRAKLDKSIMPLKARDKLMLGTSGEVKVVWRRGNESYGTTIAKAPSEMAGYEAREDGTFVLPLQPGIEKSLAESIRGRTKITLDLRNCPVGDWKSAQACLESLVPPGVYGSFDGRENSSRELKVLKGLAERIPITVLVDEGTRGPAKMLALAIAKSGRGELRGTLPGGQLMVTDLVELADGSGYTLSTARYRAPGDPAIRSAALPSTGGKA